MRIVIAEDDPAFAIQLQEYLSRFGQENHQEMQVTVYSDGAELVDRYRYDADLLLLDVEMPSLSGLDAAKSIRASDPKVLIIFITNLAQYAIRGYEVSALDYVLKPVTYYALAMKLRLALRLIRQNEEQSILLSRDGDMVRIPLSHLFYIEIYSHRLCYHTTEGDILLTSVRTLSHLEEELQESGFIRCHKSYLINLRYVDALRSTSVLLNGQEIPVSRNRRGDVLQALLHYVKGGNAL